MSVERLSHTKQDSSIKLWYDDKNSLKKLNKGPNFLTFSHHLPILGANLILKWYFSQKPTISAQYDYIAYDL